MDGKKRVRRIPVLGCNERATPPAALLPRVRQGCLDFGADLRCSLGRDRCGYRRCASRLGQRRNPQQRDPLQYFNSLLKSYSGFDAEDQSVGDAIEPVGLYHVLKVRPKVEIRGDLNLMIDLKVGFIRL